MFLPDAEKINYCTVSLKLLMIHSDDNKIFVYAGQ